MKGLGQRPNRAKPDNGGEINKSRSAKARLPKTSGNGYILPPPFQNSERSERFLERFAPSGAMNPSIADFVGVLSFRGRQTPPPPPAAAVPLPFQGRQESALVGSFPFRGGKSPHKWDSSHLMVARFRRCSVGKTNVKNLLSLLWHLLPKLSDFCALPLKISVRCDIMYIG